MKLEDVLKASSSRLETVRVVRTALNPLLWLVGIVSPLALMLTAVIDEPKTRLWLIGFAAGPVLVAIVAYFILMFRDPDRLQSEEYRLRTRALQILYKRGGDARVVKAVEEIARMDRLSDGSSHGGEP